MKSVSSFEAFSLELISGLLNLMWRASINKRSKSDLIHPLFDRAFKICSTKKLLNNQIDTVKSFMSWNGYPIGIKNFLINKLELKYKSSPSTTIAASDADLPRVWVRLPYLGKRGESLVKSCVSKIRRYLQNPIKFIIVYDTKKVSYFCSNKDKVPELSRSNVVYEITCPGCMKTYIGKTDRCIYKRLTEHSTQLYTSAMVQLLTECEHAQFLAKLQGQ